MSEIASTCRRGSCGGAMYEKAAGPIASIKAWKESGEKASTTLGARRSTRVLVLTKPGVRTRRE